MGYALADALAMQGAEVYLVSGPVQINCKNPEVRVEKVQTAKEMYQACHKYFPECTIAVLSAAVADFFPETTYNSKLKRGNEDWNLMLKPTADIAASLGKIKMNHQLLVGFALETDNEIENAMNKLHKKNFDFIVLNSLQDSGAGFTTDTNKITIIDKNNNIDKFELKSKMDVAIDITNKIIDMIS